MVDHLVLPQGTRSSSMPRCSKTVGLGTTRHNHDSKLADLEVQAKAARRGSWTDPNSLAPWDFEDPQKPKQAASTSAVHWLNTSSNVRYNESCEHFKNTKKGRSCRPDEGKACGICGG